MAYLEKKYIGLMPNGLPQIEEANTQISYHNGIPMPKEISTAYNGTPFTIDDINKLSNISINNNILFNTGIGFNTFDKSFCEKIGGYPKNSILVLPTTKGYTLVRSLVDDNIVDFTVEGIDNTNWIAIEDDISIIKNSLFEKIQEITVPRANLIGDNMKKWVKVSDITVDSIGALSRSVYSQTPASNNCSLDTCFVVSTNEEDANINPEILISDAGIYKKNCFFSKAIYTTSCYLWIAPGTDGFYMSCMSLGNIQEIFMTPQMYGTLWVRNVNYVTDDLKINVYLGQL